MSQLFTKTLRQDPTEVESPSHRLMLKAGMISQVAAGVYSYLPLALRSLQKVERIIREEMDAAGGQELRMPALHPLELWQETNRDAAFGSNLFRLKDRRDRAMVLAPTHEEVVTNLIKANVNSYRDLPLLVYQIQTKFRDEPRPRAGLIRVREFDMKDAYSFDADEEGLDLSYRRMVQAYKNIFHRCGLPTLSVEADSGAIGGKESHEFILPAESGEDFVLTCQSCHYSANAERARSTPSPAQREPEQPLQEIATPGVKTIAELAHFVGVPTGKTLKAVFYLSDSEVVFVTLRGDLEVNEVKLKNVLHADQLRLATEEEVQRADLVAGPASPVGLSGIRHLADPSIEMGSNFVVGANRSDTHLFNANYPRDFQVDLLADIALAEPGHGCPQCGEPLQGIRGIEVGHVFKLGTFFSERLGAYYLDRDGHQRPVIMGCYGIGVGRLLAAAIEQNHDDQGIIFPIPIAPYALHLMALNMDNSELAQEATDLYETLTWSGFQVLFDDRVESAGVKFNDADLLGLPIRLVVSPRTLKERSVEIKGRRDHETQLVLQEALETTIKGLLEKP